MKKEKKKKNHIWVILLLSVAIVSAVNFTVNRFVFITRYTYTNASVNDSLDGFRILQLSDIHSIRSEHQKETLIKKVKNEDPDIIVVTGDLIDSDHYSDQQRLFQDGKIEAAEKLTIEFMKELTQITAVYFIYGNHEMQLLDDVENNSFVTALKESGILFLNNAVADIRVNDSTIRLMGVQDPATLYKDTKYAFAGSNAEKVRSILDDLTGKGTAGESVSDAGSSDTAKLSAGSDGAAGRPDLTVLLSHRPEYFEMYADYDINLVFTGHTHGGIVRLPFLGGLYTRAEHFFPQYTYGKYSRGDMTMIVNGGIGYIKIPIRIFNPPEIVVLELEAD